MNEYILKVILVALCCLCEEIIENPKQDTPYIVCKDCMVIFRDAVFKYKI